MSEPTRIVAGDSLAWERSIPGYSSADGWALVYHAVSREAALPDITATPDGAGGYSVAIDAATTKLWAAGEYDWQGRVMMGAEIATPIRGRWTVVPALDGLDRYDSRTPARQMLDALEAVLIGKASQDQLSYSIGGRQLSRLSPAELLEWRDKMRAEVAREEQAAKIEAGMGGGGSIWVRM